MKKRAISLLLALALLLPMFPVQGKAADTEGGFRDVAETSWFAGAVEYVRVNGIFAGTSHTTFSPNQTMTRGMFVTVLGQMAGVDASSYAGVSSFRDVPADAWYAPHVAWAAKHGVAAGTGNGNFSPDEPVDRQQMAVFFVQYFEAFNVDYHANNDSAAVPADIDRAAPWAKDSIIKLWRAKLLVGDGVNFDPTASATRAQAAQICKNTDQAVETWYSKPGVPSGRVKIDPATGKPYPDKEPKPSPSPAVTPSPKPSTPSVGGDSSGTITTYYQVDFALGAGQTEIELPAAKTYVSGTQISSLPTPVQQDVMFLGWYYDAALTQPVGASDIVGRNMTLYAKTGGLDGLSVQESPNYITATDVETDFKLMLKGADIDPADLTITQVSANNAQVNFTVGSNGVITLSSVKNPDGSTTSTNAWAPGHTYTAVLNDDSSTVFMYDGEPQPPSIRVFNIIVKKDKVNNIALNDAGDSIKYIPKDDTSGIINFDGLFTASIITNGNGQMEIDQVEKTGSFEYSGPEKLAKGDIVAVYEGKHPSERKTPEEDEDAIVYLEIMGAENGGYSYKVAEVEDVLFTPDILPVSRTADIKETLI